MRFSEPTPRSALDARRDLGARFTDHLASRRRSLSLGPGASARIQTTTV